MSNFNHNTLKIFYWKDPTPTGATAWVVIDTLINGLSAGGLFMHCEANLEEVCDLAKTMSYKNTLLEPVIGGAKAGIRFSPDDPRAKDVIKRFLFDHQSLLKNCWYTGADLNTDNNFIFDVLEKELHFSSAFHSLGKMLNHRFAIPDQSAYLRSRLSLSLGNNFSLQTCATGYSVAMSIKLLCGGNKPSILIQGFGAVGSSLSYFLNLYNIANIVGIADAEGFISFSQGFSSEALKCIMSTAGTKLELTDAQKLAYHWSARFTQETDEDFLCRFLSCHKANIFSPCATRYQLTPKVANTLINSTFKDISPSNCFIISGANNAFQSHDIRLTLEKKGIQVLPEWVSNAGTTILFMESMKALQKNIDFKEHVFKVILRQLKSYIPENILPANRKNNTLYQHCTAIALDRIKNTLQNEAKQSFTERTVT